MYAFNYCICFEDIAEKLSLLKGYVRYIFAVLFFKSKREYFWNYEKSFLFH